MARKTKEEAFETRNLLLDAAERVFLEQGVSRTTLADIAAAAGLTRGAIYWHFKNKIDLFEAMCERVRLPMESLAEACESEDEPDPLTRIRDLAVIALTETVRNPRRRRVLSIILHKCEFGRGMEPLFLRRQAIHMDCTSRLQRGLTNAVTKRQLPVDLDTRKAAVMLHAYINGLISNWLFMPGSFDLERSAEDFMASYFAMLEDGSALRIKPKNAESRKDRANRAG
ncbi:MAG: TetR family transcriptional regulator [Porticoccaceae bacterium]